MGKNQSASNLTNIIKQDGSGNIVFTSGSTTLATISTTGQLSGSTAVKSATTASYADNFTVTGNLTAQTLIVQTITSSVDYVTGSTRFGSTLANTHVFSGSVTMNPGGLFVSSSGNVGIGIITPSGKLDVQAPGTSAFSYYFRNSNGGYGGGVYNTGANNTQLYLATSAGTENVLIAATGSSYFNGGNVGIGTNSPSNILTVASVQNLSVFRSTTTTNYVELQLENTTNYLQIGIEGGTGNRMGGTIAYNAYLGSYNNYGMTFHTNNANRMTITNAGNVGIGITGPSHKLSVVDSSFNTYSLRLESQTGNTANRWAGIGFAGESANTKAGIFFVSEGGSYSRGSLVFANNYDFNQNNVTLSDEKMRITPQGGVIVGSALGDPTGAENGWWVKQTSAPRAYFSSTREALAVNRYGSTGILIGFDYGGSGVSNISTNGSTISYNTGSDYRIKEDFKEVNGLEKLQKIKVYNFKFKGTENIMDGVIAHELQEIIPYAVNGEKDAVDEDGKMIIQGVDYSLIVPVLIKAIQELNTKLDAANAEIEALKNK